MTLNALSCAYSQQSVRKSLTFYGPQNPKFYCITVTLSIQEFFVLFLNKKFELHPDFLLKYAQIFVQISVCQLHPCSPGQQNHNFYQSALQEIGNIYKIHDSCLSQGQINSNVVVHYTLNHHVLDVISLQFKRAKRFSEVWQLRGMSWPTPL